MSQYIYSQLNMPPSGYSIGKQAKKASFIKDNHFPGVGSYQNTQQLCTSRNKKSPAYSIGKSNRLKTDKMLTQSIGPNSYDLTSTSFFNDRNRGFSLTGKRNVRLVSEGPGPGSYDGSPKNYPSPKYYSFGMRTEGSHERLIKPGPGDYELDRKKTSMCVSFQQSKRPDIANFKNRIPGPGAYNYAEHEDSSKNKFTFNRTYKFDEEKKEQNRKKQVPAPNLYLTNINQVKKRVISQKFGKGKRQFLQKNQFPGPAAYTTNNTPSKRSPVATFGNSPKNSQKQQKSPGPGKYNGNTDILKKKCPSIAFTKAHKFESKLNRWPGPGYYDIESVKHSSRCYSISGRNSLERKQISPDPGCYDVKYGLVYRRPETSIIGKSKKFPTKESQVPGPTDYKIEPKTTSKSFFFPLQKKKQLQSITPGPGAYNISPSK